MFETDDSPPAADRYRPSAPDAPLRVVALVGSSRAGSLNRALLEAARELAPASMTIEAVEIGDLPFYDGDLEAQGDPLTVGRLKSEIAAADAILVVTPEYNFSLPAVLKNAIDWASRRRPASPLAGKPVLLMGAGPGRTGARNALAHLADVLAHVRMEPFDRRLEVPHAGGLVDTDGRLSDPALRAEIGSLVAEFGESVRPAGSVVAAA